MIKYIISFIKNRKLKKIEKNESHDLLLHQLNKSFELLVIQYKSNKNKSFIQILQEEVYFIPMPLRNEYLILLENIEKENYK